MTTKTRAEWDAADRAHQLQRWRYIIEVHEITAEGHRLITHGGHTGHMVTTVALCETAEIAPALAEALARARPTGT